MSSPYGHNPKRINKLWFVALFALIVFFSIIHRIQKDIEEIAQNTSETQRQLDELLNNAR